MLTYALVAFTLINGQVHTETLDYGMSQEDCEFAQTLHRDVFIATEADFVPLACVAEREA